ncbi:NAC domain-containing protein 14-like isoform X2 [Phragmites australis]|uniref:NAC domain-containing protein 14-like isoform X2 n=1 Tax=Phragmites australis TaxID=29695 RepID=UPI002D7703A2|nr:NAC domain-containing protein 14-like isoform X2 [Phragmites australis]
MSAPAALPVGFRFRPTDEELVRHYLKAKIAGRAHPDLLFIPDVDLSACEPWELPAKALIKSDDPEWFFFAPLDRKYPGGLRSNRSTAAGYWKATGKDRLIRSRPGGTLIGVKKTLVFHRGRAPRGHRTAWIMHEYRTAEPQLPQGQNGSFVLYRLFNKHEEEASTLPGSNSEDSDSPSTSSPANPQHVQGTITQVVKAENLIRPASGKMPHLLTTVDNNEPTATKEDDPLLDVLAQLPDLQPEQKYDGFPTITSPMRPYTDHPFVGNVGGQDLSAYINSIIAHQDLEDLLLNPALAKTDEHPTGNAEPNPTALLMPSNSSNNKRLPETSWTKSDSDDVLLIQGADGTGAAHCSSATKILQMDTGDANHDTGAQTNLAYSESTQVSHLYNQYQLQSAYIPENEPPNSGALCPAGSWTPSQHLFNNMVEPSRSDMTNSDAFNALEGWAAEPTMQQFTVSNFMDPQQGTAARRIRLVHSVQRPSVTEPVLTSHLESEDEAGSCYSTHSSSSNHNKDDASAGEAMHIQGGGVIPTQVLSSVEVTGKLQDFSFDEGTSPHGELPHGGDLKQRLKQEHRKTSQNVCEGLQHSERVPGEPTLRRRRQPTPIGSVVRLLCLALVVILAFVGLWKSSLCKSLLW